MLVERRRKRRLRSSRGRVVRVVRFLPDGGHVVRVIPVRRPRGHRGVRGRRVPVALRATKQPSDGVLDGGGEVRAAAAAAATPALAVAGLRQRFVLHHFCLRGGHRSHFVAARLRHVHPDRALRVRRNAVQLSSAFSPLTPCFPRFLFKRADSLCSLWSSAFQAAAHISSFH